MQSEAAFPTELAFLSATRSNTDHNARLQDGELHDLQDTPFFTYDALQLVPGVFSQRGLLGTVLSQHRDEATLRPQDPRFYINPETPLSGVICGVQVRTPQNLHFSFVL